MLLSQSIRCDWCYADLVHLAKLYYYVFWYWICIEVAFQEFMYEVHHEVHQYILIKPDYLQRSTSKTISNVMIERTFSLTHTNHQGYKQLSKHNGELQIIRKNKTINIYTKDWVWSATPIEHESFKYFINYTLEEDITWFQSLAQHRSLKQ